VASVFTLDTAAQGPAERKIVWRIGVGAAVTCRRTTDGAIIVALWRGDGGGPEAYTYHVRSIEYPMLANVALRLTIADLDLDLPNGDPRSYRLIVTADAGGDLGVTSALIAPAPYAPAGAFP